MAFWYVTGFKVEANWRWVATGQVLNLDPLRQQLGLSRDYLFSAAGIPQNLFSSQ